MVAELTLDTPGLVHPIVSEDQAVYIHQALLQLLNTPEGDLSGSPEQEAADRQALSELVYFWAAVIDHPEQFGVRMELETKAMLRAVKPVKGPAKLSSRRHGRKRQTGRGQRKRNSLDTRVEAEAYNEALRRVEADKAEMEQAHNDEMKKRIDRSNELITKDSISNEELQELLDIMGYSNVAEAARLMRAEQSTDRRIEAAVERARAETPED
jgi:hypothetical protein